MDKGMMNLRTLLLGLVFAANAAFAAPQEVDKVIAIVDHGVVLRTELDNMMQTVKQGAQQANQQLPDDLTLRRQVLDRLITDNIQLQMAKKMGVNVTDKELDQAIADIAAQNNATVDQLRAHLASQHIDYSAYRNQIRKEIMISQVRENEVRQRVTILPQEVEALSKQVAAQSNDDVELNLSHILIPLPEKPSPQQLSQAEELMKQVMGELKRGADFGKLAATYSADPQALKGGQMGWGKLQELPSVFAEKLQQVQKGDVVGPIRSGVGLHLLKVNDIRGSAGQSPLQVTEVHARHILLRASVVMTDDQAKAKLQQVAQDIKSGRSDFETEAKKLSQDPGSALQGGDLGWSSPDAYDPAFRAALLQLHKGELSAPVRSNFGWHLIQLVDTRQVDKTDAAQKDRAYRMLFNRKFTEEAQIWLQEIRAGAYVKILDGSNAGSSK